MKYLHLRGLTALAALVLMLAPVNANSLPILLAERNVQLGGGSQGIHQVPPITQVGFELIIGVHNSLNDACPGNSLLGCQPIFTPGQTGVFDFNASNASNFGFMVSRLTDESDESLTMWHNLYDASGTLIGGAGSGGLESQKFGGLLTGRTIDFFRLIVDLNSVENLPSGDGFDHRTNFTWQIWGTGDPLPPRPPPSAVPEPSTLLLLGSGLAGLGGAAWQRRRRRRKTG